MRKHLVLLPLVAAVASFALTACGTISNVQDGGHIYGGVRSDVETGSEGLTELQSNTRSLPKGLLVLGVSVAAIDLPLTVIGDTLTLPITIRRALFGRSDHTEITPPPTDKQVSDHSQPVSAEEK
jgi:uncharacterized protein YceK